MAEHTTQAVGGHGTELEVQIGAAWEQIHEVTELNPGDPDISKIDCSHLSSPGNRSESIPGRVENGVISGKLNWNPLAYADHARLQSDLGDRTAVRNYRVTLPSGLQVIVCAAWVMSLKFDSVTGDKQIVKSFELQMTGEPTYS